MLNQYNTDANITIIGAGVVGLALAARLSLLTKNLFLLEKHPRFGQETSSRNSEVIHSGVYYPTNSLKTKLCIRGNEMLYDYCRQKDINHLKTGKLVVATDATKDKLLINLYNQACKNGAMNARLLSASEVRNMESTVFCTSAILFPETGIVDSHGLMKQLETDSLLQGANIAYQSEVIKIEQIKEGYKLSIREDKGIFEFTTHYLINSTGLASDRIARMSSTYEETDELHFWKGEYFAVKPEKTQQIHHLIYPVPDPGSGGVGVHLTFDLNHGSKLGPNAIYLPKKEYDYKVDPQHLHHFYTYARQFLPFLMPDDLHPDQAGIRPKLSFPGAGFRDFIIRRENHKEHPNLINLIGIESPGLTSSLAIADYVASLLSDL